MKLTPCAPDVIVLEGPRFRYVVRHAEATRASGRVSRCTYLQRQEPSGDGCWDDSPGLSASELAAGLVAGAASGLKSRRMERRVAGLVHLANGASRESRKLRAEYVDFQKETVGDHRLSAHIEDSYRQRNMRRKLEKEIDHLRMALKAGLPGTLADEDGASHNFNCDDPACGTFRCAGCGAVVGRCQGGDDCKTCDDCWFSAALGQG